MKTELAQPIAPQPRVADYFGRVVKNDNLKRGAAGALASVLVALIVEAAWPSKAS